MSVLDKPEYKKFLLDRYHEYPQGKYVNLILIRKTESEAVFRTEGSGEPLCWEFVHAGAKKRRNAPVQRIVITKRKQTAVERRTGREDLRKQGLPCLTDEGNSNPESVDAYLYGHAVGQDGAQKSRVITEDAFSILSTAQVMGNRTSNKLYDTGTMIDVTGKQSESLFNSDYVRPETHFLDIETLKDVTADELFYVLGNILRTSRYGAISTRIGKVKNTLAQVIFSDTEVFSTLELTQQVYDALCPADDSEPDFPLSDEDVLKAVVNSSNALITPIIGQYQIIVNEDLTLLVEEVRNIYRDPTTFLQRLASSYSGG
jgi:CRISPR-associated protein Csc2